MTAASDDAPTADDAGTIRPIVESAHPRLRASVQAPLYASFGRRALAFLIDAVILGIFGAPLTWAGVVGLKVGLAALDTPARFGTEAALTSLFSAAWLTMAGIYFTVLQRGEGQTIGKAVLGIRVLTTRHVAIGTVRSLVRTLGYLASSSFFGVGFLLAALTPRTRAWHDFLAGTCVVCLESGEA